jgi:acyl transferase domain-containing protein
MYGQYPWQLPSPEEAELSSNVTDWSIANRVSHLFDLSGPSLSVNSACSSSLTAIHLACESLIAGSCSMAVAGGVNLMLSPSRYAALLRAKLLGSGQESQSFGAGDGYIPGEGVGAVLLKPLDAALADGDKIEGIIKSSFINHGGGRQAFGTFDPKRQAELIARTVERAGIDVETIGYVECAANGSRMGDPIEVVALSKAFSSLTSRRQFCALGAVKSNLGHLEAASGVSQLAKVLLQFKHARRVPTLHARPRNPNLRLEGTPFFLQETLDDWQAPLDPRTGQSAPRRSLINSFGAGGSYASLVVEEAPALVTTHDSFLEPAALVFAFSAHTASSLSGYTHALREFLKRNAAVSLLDVSHSLWRRNPGLEHRVAIVASSRDELLAQLAGEPATGGAGAAASVAGTGRAALEAVAAAWKAGAPLDSLKSPGGRVISLPGYHFERPRQLVSVLNADLAPLPAAPSGQGRADDTFDEGLVRAVLARMSEKTLSRDNARRVIESLYTRSEA